MTIRIGLAQLDCAAGQVEENCRKIEDYAHRAAAQGCAAVLFPEMADTGYEIGVIRERASSWEGFPFRRAQQAAAVAKIHLICGLSERDGARIFNSLALFSPAGALLGRYRKAHLFTPEPVREERCFAPGDGLTTVDAEGMRWGFSICYDLRFPELCRALALRGAEVLVNCSAWPQVRREHWQILSQARAIENQAWFLAVNRVGEDGGFRFAGLSRIVDPEGKVVAEAAPDREQLLIGEIDGEAVRRCRAKLPVFASRRGDLYGNPGLPA
ncbi:MAG: carbon-nitrogen family hydrolase [Deltaproteobacteria bacterium]|nr:carbon-nitrogen family hydrolase [Deltaproteobacteria bacterium]